MTPYCLSKKENYNEVIKYPTAAPIAPATTPATNIFSILLLTTKYCHFLA
jgi:hypothetical protein